MSSWNMGTVRYMYSMFKNCSKLSDLSPISGWSTGNMRSSRAMFEGCTSLKTLDALASWDTSKIEDARWMFKGCTELADTRVIGGWDLSGLMSDSGVTDGSRQSAVYQMFLNTPKLSIVGIPIVSKGGVQIAQAYNPPVGMRWTPMVSSGVDLPDSVVKISQKKVVDGMKTPGSAIAGYRVWSIAWQYWGTCPWWFDEETKTLHVNGGVGADVTLQNAAVPTLEDRKLIPWWSVHYQVEKIETEGKVVMPSKSCGLFIRMVNLKDVSGLKNWDASNVTDMSNLFRSDNLMDDTKSALKSINALSGWDVSKVQSMSCMFWGNRWLESLDALSRWDTESLTETTWMFQGCARITSLKPLANWKMGKVTMMGCMFEGCNSLTNLEGLESWDTSSLRNAAGMFSSYGKVLMGRGVSQYNPALMVNESIG